jgi:uncharacterized protein YjiS (DUF1127 family)
MATITQAAGGHSRQSASGGVFKALVASVVSLFDRLERRAAVKALSELDDRALRDIGISRCQIEDAVYGQVKAELKRYL